MGQQNLRGGASPAFQPRPRLTGLSRSGCVALELVSVSNWIGGTVRKLVLPMVMWAAVACRDGSPLEPLSALTYVTAIPSCGPADGPATVILLASAAFELPQPSAPYIQVFVPRRFTESSSGEVFEIGENFDEEANAWFYRSGVETQSATRGEVGITSLRENTLTGYVDLVFPDGVRMRGSFIASWQNRETFCG